jgi:transcriptional regulator with XRE-family HTH domain
MSTSRSALAQRIRDLRTELGWSTDRLSKETGRQVESGFLRRLECGAHQDMPLVRAIAIASAFGISIDELAGVEDVSKDVFYRRGYADALKAVVEFAAKGIPQ